MLFCSTLYNYVKIQNVKLQRGKFDKKNDDSVCFRSNEGQTAEEAEEAEEEEEEESSTDKPNLSEEALINAVNESAEEGIAWFTSLLGLSFGGGNGTGAAEAAETAPTAATPQRQRSFNAIPLK